MVVLKAYGKYELTKIRVRVTVMTRSHTTEDATHPMITPTKSEKPAKRPTLTVKIVYAIPPAINQKYVPPYESGSISWRTELGNCQDHDKSEQGEVRRENSYPPREEYLDAARN